MIERNPNADMRAANRTSQGVVTIGSKDLLADVVSYINDQSKQFRQCAGHHAEHNPGAEAVAYRAAEVLDRIAADIKSANASNSATGDRGASPAKADGKA